jgi:hypothetical protein
LPTRLIEVGRSDDLESSLLLETNSAKGFYAALSYCWGTFGANCLTTIDNLEAHKRRIPWERLPRTIQDAILVTWKLKIPYIWVDALCIIQTAHFETETRTSAHTGEWASEANKMSSVYQNAYITIAAGSAADC